MTLEVVLFTVAAVLFAITYWMFWAGLAASVRMLWLKRCPDCGHLHVTTAFRPGAMTSQHCMYCRHPRAAAHMTHRRLRHNFRSEW